jgi:2-C-methyl-D-erythritol 2,4-cyclodiphosphate synthase
MDNLRIGIGFDIHRFQNKKKLVLGGVIIPYHLGLSGHSDADVLLHALCDAMLGAMAKPDIGCYFSDKDSKNKNMPSTDIVKKVKSIMRKDSFELININCVIIADEPKINTCRDKIVSKLSKILSIDKQCIGISAKTTEGIMSFSRKGIASYCIALLKKIK